MNKTNTGKMVGLLVAAILAVAILAISVEPAEAAGVPTKVVAFTDKKVYIAWWMDRATSPTFKRLDDSPSQTIYLYAFVLDDDGNIMKNRAVSVTFNDTTFDHWQKSNWARHSDMVGNNTYFTSTKNLNDTGTFGDAISGDGLYTATMGMPSSLETDVATNPRMDDHVRVKMVVRDTATGLNTTVYALVSWGKCHSTSTSHPSKHVGSTTGSDLCTNCHSGYEHFFEGISNTIPYEYQDVHYKVLGDSLPDSTEYGNGDIGSTYWAKFLWNSSQSNGAVADISWKNRSGGGAVFCLFCHKDPAGTNVLDYGAGDRSNMAERPSCSQSTSGYGGLSCHSTTEIEGATVIPWSQGGAVSNANDTLVGINRQKAHNKSGILANVSCTLCHTVPHSLTMPNMSADISSSGSISDQCVTCHNITGGLNITANGGTNVPHDGKTNCKNCHIDNNRLDPHRVPTGVFGGKWCLNCHDITGKSPINMKVDPAVMNISNPNFIHYTLNKNSDATNSSRICWACHTNNSYVINGLVNSTSLPASEHPTGYDAPRNCLSCHNNTNPLLNFSASQTNKHTWYAGNMKTPAVTYCGDCHGKEENLIAWSESVFPPKTSNESAAHYGRNRTSFFLPLVGTRQYCAYCHQNESTVMGPFANPENEVRSDHASQVTTPGCGNNTCHRPGRMHEDTLVVPSYTESNIATTCLACHPSANYSAHNSTVTCWDCHMGNVSNTNATWIHPIQFIQYNGNFTGAKLTGATCYDCHKSTSVDNVMQTLSGKKAPKVYNQVHSNDPNNGTKWGNYWKYTPTTYQFASYYVGSGIITPSYPFDNIRVPSNEYMEITEQQTGSSNDPVIFPYNLAEGRIDNPPVANWTSSTSMSGNTAGSTIKTQQDATFGRPAGSLKAIFTTGSGSGTIYGYAWWNYSFYYNPDYGQFVYTNASVSYNITVSSGNTQTAYLRLIKPSGAVVTLASSGPITADTGWLNLTNNSFASALTENGSVNPYKIQLYIEFQGVKTSKTYTVWYDNILVKFQEKVWNKYDLIINTTGVPVNGSSKLGLSYQVHNENTSLFIYNKTSKAYELLDYLDSGVFFDYSKSINSTNHINSSDGITGNVSVRFVDNDQGDTDSISDKFHIRYLYIYTDRGLQYPCEQCHSPNKHYVYPTIGSPEKFKGSNKYNSTDLKNSTWCQQCHWDKASNYSKMIQEFNVTRNPPENVPPEITGNKTYGNFTVSKDGKTAYVNHSGSSYSDMNDSGCFQCHGKSGDTTTSQFVHNVQVGVSGNRKCITCHNATATNFKKIDVEAVRRGMHAGLKNASANVSNTSNPVELACWACHGDGMYNNSDQHRNAIAWTCDRCHTNSTIGKLGYSAPMVYEHIPPNLATHPADINTTFNGGGWACEDCHNNSINNTALTNDNEGDPRTAITGHYGLNRTGSKLMYDYLTPPKGNSEDCIYCHKGNINNMTKWGIVTASTKNLSNKLSPTDHRTFGNGDCGGCHNYTATSSFTFHVAEMNAGAGASGPNCKNCHDIGKSASGKLVNFSAMNDTSAIHKNLNSGAVTALDAENKKCWACHGDGSEPSGHPSNYKSPYNCTDCHNSSGSQSGKYPGWNITEHVKAGTISGTEIFTPQAGNCYACHNKSEMMIPAYDPDNGTGAVYGGANGGNISTSHYGLKRDLGTGDAYCNYCHSNTSSVFPYVNQHNKSIFEHTTNTTADITNTSLTCANSICHGTGRIHNASLIKPSQTVWTSGQKDYCAPCHNSTGSANKKVYNQWHDTVNSSTDNITNCNYCHDSGSLGSTTLSYNLNVHSDNLTYPAGAVSCVACHNVSSTYVKSRKILTHFPGASKDKGNTSLSARTCEACHGIAGKSMHASGLVKKPNYTCADCHVSTAGGPYWSNQSFNSYIDTTSHDNTSTSNVSNCVWCHNSSSAPAPLHFTEWANGSVAKPGWGGWQAGRLVNCTDCHDSSYNNKAPFYAPAKPHAGTGNNTDECYSCHTNVNTYDAAPLAVHNVVQAPGNANCTKCHDIGGAASKEVDVAAMNRSNSIHLNLNSGAADGNATAPYAADSKRCWACHGDGTDKNDHDQVRYKNPYRCEDCHTASGSKSGKYPSYNITEHFAGGTDIRTANAGNCYTCHNIGEMLQGHNDAEVLSANASVGHYGRKRTDMRSGVNTTCTYCHQNSTTVFESVMLKSSNKSIFEHTDTGAKNTTGRSCTDGNCHAQGYIHNITLTKPSVQVWTSGKQDFCAPCHKPGNVNATKYVYGHNSSNITVVSSDCGYCHNSSSQGSTGGPLKIHSSTLTNKSTVNPTCVSCHQDATYVTGQRVINTHYPGAPAGKANTSLDSFTCEACHGNMQANKMHSVVSIPGDRCNNCHNGTVPGSYKATMMPYVDITRHDNSSHNVSNSINCEWCHNNSNAIQKFHFTQYPNGTVQAPGWAGWSNGTNANCTSCHDTYKEAKPFYAEPIWHKGSYGTTLDNCYQCHTNVSSKTNGYAPIALHNVTKTIDWSYCNNCHSNNYGGAPIVDNNSLASSMHFGLNNSSPYNTEPACKACHGGNSTVHKNATAYDCTYCHVAPVKYGAKNVSRHIPYPYTTIVNTSRYQNVFCSDCHNNSLGTFTDPTPYNKNATTSHYGVNKTAGKLMYDNTGNSEDCIYCHRNPSNMASWGILSTSNANLSKKGGNHATASNSDCYTCHVNSTTTPATFHLEDISAGAGGGPDCKACHNIGGNAVGKLVNFSAMNGTNAIHKNLNKDASAVVDAENKKCWACHTTNGTAPQTGNHSFVDRYKNPYNCTDCHISSTGQNFNYTPNNTLLNVTQHKADSLNGTTIFTPLAQDCYSCHNKSEMMVQAYDPDNGTGDVYNGLHGGNNSVSHYGLKRGLGTGDAYCNYCHSNASSIFPYLNDRNKNIIEHTANALANISNSTTLRCIDCHKNGKIHDDSLNKTPQSAWTSGKQDFCAPCHKPKPTGSTNKSVYLQGHDPTYSSDDRIGDCGFCHNASSQGINGSYLNVHSETLTNKSTVANSITCQGCHNGTAVYTGTEKQILSHMPNASMYRGNTSTSNYDCKYCHNMTNKLSMHSSGMDRSNGTCDTCHRNNTSPFKSTTKNITQLTGGMLSHSYNGSANTTCKMCHNASGRVKFHLSKYASGDIADPQDSSGAPTFPDRSIWNAGDSDNRGILVDCRDCHEMYNDTAPFFAPFFEANITQVNNQEHVGKNYKLQNCYVCHTSEDSAGKPYTVHNVSVEPLSGGPNCTKCHNIGAIDQGKAPDNMLVNFTAFNGSNSRHRNLTNATLWGGSAIFGLIDTACWACHQSDGKQMERHPDLKDNTSLTGGSMAYRCQDCHTVNGVVSSLQPSIYQKATKVYKHYPGSQISATKKHSSDFATGSCQVCHNNSIEYNNVTANINATVSHYVTTVLLMQTDLNSSCWDCHVSTSNYGIPKQLANGVKHSMNSVCQGPCHNPNYVSASVINPVTIHNTSIGIYYDGCYKGGCHIVPSGPPRGGR